jgi:hypothetical protein
MESLALLSLPHSSARAHLLRPGTPRTFVNVSLDKLGICIYHIEKFYSKELDKVWIVKECMFHSFVIMMRMLVPWSIPMASCTMNDSVKCSGNIRNDFGRDDKSFDGFASFRLKSESLYRVRVRDVWLIAM